MVEGDSEKGAAYGRVGWKKPTPVNIGKDQRVARYPSLLRQGGRAVT